MKTFYQCDFIGIKCYRQNGNIWEHREYYKTRNEETGYSPWTECLTFKGMKPKQVIKQLELDKDLHEVPFFENWKEAKKYYESVCPY
jgi:hypothetical protein